MQIVEVLLPLDRGDGTPIEPELVEGFVAGLADRFGGATAYSREPADGVWRGGSGLECDRILVIEVMLEAVDQKWWRDYRSRLEAELGQEQRCRLGRSGLTLHDPGTIGASHPMLYFVQLHRQFAG